MNYEEWPDVKRYGFFEDLPSGERKLDFPFVIVVFGAGVMSAYLEPVDEGHWLSQGERIRRKKLEPKRLRWPDHSFVLRCRDSGITLHDFTGWQMI
uniref:Uncharacterized protein n=1 Tax=viral metagenome TaxID=1070528 RepID=A0A6M3L8P4_9ZZZZ